MVGNLIVKAEDTVKLLSGNGAWENLVLCSVTDRVRVLNHFFRIAGGPLVVTLARITVPALALCQYLPRSGSGNQSGVRGEQRSIQEISARYSFLQAEDFC